VLQHPEKIRDPDVKLLLDTLNRHLEKCLRMSDENKKEGKIKEIRVGESITFSDKVTVIKIRGEAMKELDKLPQSVRQEVLNEAIELSKNTTHPYDVTKEDGIEARKKRGAQS
jgi:hypothetical protein